jgi:hypothetical protein
MPISRLYKFFAVPSTEGYSFPGLFWFSHSLTFSFLYAALALGKAFSSEYVVQDDARQHVFWMMRFVDPALFPNDPIAHYFQSVAPSGYSALYRLAAILGLSPLVFNKLLPIILGAIATIYCYRLSVKLLPVPFAGFCSSVILNLTLWMRDDLVSGTPRAFIYPLFFSFLYYLLENKSKLCWMAIALTSLFYPQLVLLESGILVLYLFHVPHFKLTRSRSVICFVGLVVAFFVLLPYELFPNPFSPLISVADAKTYPEFWPGGRNSFFESNVRLFWLTGERSGFIPKRTPAILWLGLILPVLFWKGRDRFRLLDRITPHFSVLFQVLAASCFWFIAAHLLLFKLHLPSRYAIHSLILCFALLSGMTIAILVEGILAWGLRSQSVNPEKRPVLTLVSVGLMVGVLVLYPLTLKEFPRTSYQVEKNWELYDFFKQTPKDAIVASIEPDADNIPTFSLRSILVGEEYSISYHAPYHQAFRQRLLDLVRAHYSPNLADVKQLIAHYGIDFFLIHKSAFTPQYLLDNRWLNGLRTSIVAPEDPLSQAIERSFQQLQAGTVPALTRVIGPCTAYQTSMFFIVDASCANRQN